MPSKTPSYNFKLPYPKGVTPTIHNDIYLKINECLDQFEDHYGYRPSPPELKFNLKGRVAGSADSYYNRIRINLDVLLNNTEDYINTTIPHELAHILVSSLWAKLMRSGTRKPYPKPHGKEWKDMMCFLGVPAKRCHNYSVKPSRRQRRWAYSCGCSDRIRSIATTSHNRIQRRKIAIECTVCNKDIVFTGDSIIK